LQIDGKRFLITGGASLIGSHLAQQLLDAGAAEVVLFDNLSLGSEAVLKSFASQARVRVVRGDVLSLTSLIDAFEGIDGVFALAAYLTLPIAAQPRTGIEVNVVGMLNLLDAARIRSVSKIVFASSIAVYGSEIEGLVDETVGFGSHDISPAFATYASSKLLGESLGRLYAQKGGPNFCSVRYSTVYGENQHSRGVNALAILQAIEAVARGEAPTILGDGSEAHDYIYVGDAAAGTIKAMERGPSGEAINIVTGVSTSVKQVVESVLDVRGSALQPVYAEDKRTAKSTGHERLDLSNEKAKTLLGWTAQTSVRDGIARLSAWLDSRD